MKVVILAGGFGTRLAELTDLIPKPMVRIGNKPILWHIMNTYASYGFKDFVIALGYKSEYVKNYFLNYNSLNSDFTINLKDGSLHTHSSSKLDWNITLVDTGIETMTGGRIKNVGPYLNGKQFMVTYGDGVADINIEELVRFHNSHGKKATVSTVHPGARFGELEIEDGIVKSFQEKPQTQKGWINGGYFVFENEFLNDIDNELTVLEREPLETAAKKGELMAYKHDGFWQCMDTIRDKEYLNDLWSSNKAPWKK